MVMLMMIMVMLLLRMMMVSISTMITPFMLSCSHFLCFLADVDDDDGDDFGYAFPDYGDNYFHHDCTIHTPCFSASSSSVVGGGQT